MNSADGMTMAFLTMSMAEIFHAFNMRSPAQKRVQPERAECWCFGASMLGKPCC